MSQTPERPFSNAALDSADYRTHLMGKLNCLIAVLEVASGKVRMALGGPQADLERLGRIHKNLRDTLEICQRARRALERRTRVPVKREAGRPAAARARRGRLELEMCSSAEAARFRRLAPIDRAALREVDLDELARLLQG